MLQALLKNMGEVLEAINEKNTHPELLFLFCRKAKAKKKKHAPVRQ